MDSSGPVPFGAVVTLAARIPLHPPPDPRKVAPGTGPGRTDADPDRLPGQETGTARDRAARAPVDPQTPAGPPPAFEITLLEMEADLRQIIARIEAARAHRHEDAAAPVETPDGPPQTGPAGKGMPVPEVMRQAPQG